MSNTPSPLTTLTEDETMFAQAFADFFRDQVGPHVHTMDKNQQLDPGLIKQFFEMGLMGIEIPEEYGGAGGNFFMSILAIEEAAAVDPAVSVFIDVQNTLVINALHKWGNDEQKARYFPRMATDLVGAYALSESSSGSDAFALRCRAERDGDDWILTGNKLWITNANEAGVFIVFANTDFDAGYRGITAFLVERDMDGFKTAVKEAEEFFANPPPEAEEEEEEEEEEGEEEDEDPEEEGDDGEESSADEDGSEEEGEAEAVATGGGGGGADSSDDEGAHKPAAAAADGAAPAADGEAELKAQLKAEVKAEVQAELKAEMLAEIAAEVKAERARAQAEGGVADAPLRAHRRRKARAVHRRRLESRPGPLGSRVAARSRGASNGAAGTSTPWDGLAAAQRPGRLHPAHATPLG